MGYSLIYPLSLTLVVLCSRLVASQPAYCDATNYGRPIDSDCTTLFQKVTESQVLQSRLFDEEQLRAEPDLSWPGIDNPFVPSIIQVPKYYSMSQSTMRP